MNHRGKVREATRHMAILDRLPFPLTMMFDRCPASEMYLLRVNELQGPWILELPHFAVPLV